MQSSKYATRPNKVTTAGAPASSVQKKQQSANSSPKVTKVSGSLQPGVQAMSLGNNYSATSAPQQRTKSWLIGDNEYHFPYAQLQINPLNPDAHPDEHLAQQLRFTGVSVNLLNTTIRAKCSLNAISYCLQQLDTSPISKRSLVADGWQAMYYAVEQNSEDIVSLLLQHDIDAKAAPATCAMPLLLWAIMQWYFTGSDTSNVVKQLLVAGYDPLTVPTDMWAEPLKTPQENPQNQAALPDTAIQASAWCSLLCRKVLAQSLHLTHRWSLYLAHDLPPLLPRKQQILTGEEIEKVSKLPYFLIGQRSAANTIVDHVYSHIAIGEDKPLVIAFSGLSGHGKTELALALGELLSTKTDTIDMAAMFSSLQLFGAPASYQDRADGSKLNNHLATYSGRRSVVFLDEFHQEQPASQGLAITHDAKRQTIWILATNFGSDVIEDYYEKHVAQVDEKHRHTLDLHPLQMSLKRAYMSKFGKPLTGRISLVVPFLPFTPTECTMLLHRFFLDFVRRMRLPIDLHSGKKRFPGHCRVSIVDDGKVCAELSKQYYVRDLGARSLDDALREVKHAFIMLYSDTEKLVTEEMNHGPLQGFSVRLVEQVGGGSRVVVTADPAE